MTRSSQTAVSAAKVKTLRRQKRFTQGVGGLAVLCGACLASHSASANGRFPLANHLAIDPTDPNHLVVGATFGLLESRDGGNTFSWTCELVLGLADQEDPMIVVSDQGTTVLATFDGIVTSADGCSYRSAPELEGQIVPDLARSPGVEGQLYGFTAFGLPAGRFESQLVRSDDGGRTWTKLTPSLPDTVLPLTIDVSEADPQRIYLTARLDRSANYESVLLRSDDGGETFVQTPIPGTQGQRFAFIAALHPSDPDQLFLRVDDNEGTPVLHSRDGGQSFETIFTGLGRLLGFALAPDGETIALGGPTDGLWTGTLDGLEQRSELGPTCLRFSDETLYACADASVTGFSLARSTDLGANFEPLLRFEALCGVTACDENTLVGRECRAAWDTLAPRLGASCGVTPGSGGASSGSAGQPSTAPDPQRRATGCALATGEPSRNAGPYLAALVTWLTLRRRRRAQPACSSRPSA